MGNSNFSNNLKCKYCGEELGRNIGRCPWCGSLQGKQAYFNQTWEETIPLFPQVTPPPASISDVFKVPAVEVPAREAPAVEAPVVIMPVDKVPAVDTLVVDTLVVDALVVDAPVVYTPVNRIATQTIAPSTALSNGLKVLITAITTVIPFLGQLAGLIIAIVFMNSDGEPDKRSFGCALLTLSIIMFIIACLASLLFIAALLAIV